MGFFGFLILGILAGAIAKLILPGKQGGGWISTLIIGIIGAMLGGWIAGFFDADVYTGLTSITGWIAAIVGAIVVLLIWGFITKNRNKGRTNA